MKISEFYQQCKDEALKYGSEQENIRLDYLLAAHTQATLILQTIDVKEGTSEYNHLVALHTNNILLADLISDIQIANHLKNFPKNN